jgi:hypothetical protein
LVAHGVTLTPNALHLLQHGRHMRLGATTKIIVGRTQQDNERLTELYSPEPDTHYTVKHRPGPTVVMPGGGPENMRFLAASICAGYSKAPETSPTAVMVTTGGKTEALSVLPVTPDEAKRFLIT